MIIEGASHLPETSNSHTGEPDPDLWPKIVAEKHAIFAHKQSGPDFRSDWMPAEGLHCLSIEAFGLGLILTPLLLRKLVGDVYCIDWNEEKRIHVIQNNCRLRRVTKTIHTSQQHRISNQKWRQGHFTTTSPLNVTPPHTDFPFHDPQDTPQSHSSEGAISLTSTDWLVGRLVD